MLEMLKTEDTVRDSEEIEKNSTDLLCDVCSDQATGRHYGTIACNGCKGFFRRTIRRGYKYTCRFNGNCNIDKHNRAVCRACRYMRCINAGMKVNAVQNERDVIGRRNRTPSSSLPSTSVTAATQSTNAEKPDQANASYRKQFCNNGQFAISSTNSLLPESWDTPRSLLESLLVSEKKIQSLRESVIKQTDIPVWTKDQLYRKDGAGRTATVKDIYMSIHSQLLLVIEWAKTIPPFAALSTDDQTALLKNFASQHIILGVSYRSKDNSDFLKLLNDSCIPRCRDEVDAGLELCFRNIYFRDCERIMDQLVAPMKFLKIDDVEFVALKACVLFNPVAKGLSSSSVMDVLATRRRIFGALEHYISTKIPTDVNRIGDLTFFILSPLQALANAVCEDVLIFKLSGVAHIDQLMEELILAETEEQKVPNRINSESLSVKNLYAEMIKTSNLSSSVMSNNVESVVPNQTSKTQNASSSGDIISDFEEPTYHGYSPTTTTLASYTVDPFKSNPSSPMELLPTSVPSVDSPTYLSTWTAPLSHCSTYFDNDDYYAASTMDL